MLRIYTDGACSNNGKPNAKASWAFVVIEKKSGIERENFHLSGRVQGKQTNNTGELIAIIEAMKFAINQFQDAIIYSDSRYAIDSISKWNINKTLKGEPKKNIELIKEAQDLYFGSRDFEILWVKGHDGNPFNDRADEEAVVALTGLDHICDSDLPPLR